MLIFMSHKKNGLQPLSLLVRKKLSAMMHLCMFLQWTTVADSLITAKHNVDCTVVALPSAYKPTVLASADIRLLLQFPFLF